MCIKITPKLIPSTFSTMRVIYFIPGSQLEFVDFATVISRNRRVHIVGRFLTFFNPEVLLASVDVRSSEEIFFALTYRTDERVWGHAKTNIHIGRGFNAGITRDLVSNTKNFVFSSDVWSLSNIDGFVFCRTRERVSVIGVLGGDNPLLTWL